MPHSRKSVSTWAASPRPTTGRARTVGPTQPAREARPPPRKTRTHRRTHDHGRPKAEPPPSSSSLLSLVILPRHHPSAPPGLLACFLLPSHRISRCTLRYGRPSPSPPPPPPGPPASTDADPCLPQKAIAVSSTSPALNSPPPRQPPVRPIDFKTHQHQDRVTHLDLRWGISLAAQAEFSMRGNPLHRRSTGTARSEMDRHAPKPDHLRVVHASSLVRVPLH